MKALAIALAVVAAVLAVLYGQELRTNGKLQDRNTQLSAQLSDRTGKETEAAKTACSTKTAQVFHAMGYSESDNGNSGRLPSYTNHYNPKLKRCLMMVETDMTQTGAVMKQIFDADERTPIGDYYWIPSATKKYWEQAPIDCHMMPPGKEEGVCHSTAEWDNYASSLMG